MTAPPKKPQLNRRLSVAPMMDWTTRHCRYLHRLLSRETVLYTEMITAAALVHGDAQHLLAFHPAEHPVALQIGGSDPDMLARATDLGVAAGYDEINLNLGCPSDRVQSGQFGATLMQQPELVTECLLAMAERAPNTEITVKCRIGVDDQTPALTLPDFITHLRRAGIGCVIIHARMAWLSGLSPKENRDIPPLDYDLVHKMKADNPDLQIIINGGLDSLDVAMGHINGGLSGGLDGAMIGRAAWHSPFALLADADQRAFGTPAPDTAPCPRQIARAMLPYIRAQLEGGVRMTALVRPMLGLFTGMRGARMWRRILSECAHLDDADERLIEKALLAMNCEL